MGKQRLPLVLVEWEDAYSGNHDWFKSDTLPEAVDPLMVMTAGFLVQSNHQRITVAQSFSHDSMAALWTIPRPMVRSITKLETVEVQRSEETAE